MHGNLSKDGLFELQSQIWTFHLLALYVANRLSDWPLYCDFSVDRLLLSAEEYPLMLIA